MGSETKSTSRLRLAVPIIALAGALGLAANAQAGGFPPDCTIGNWGDNVGLDDSFTGYQGANNRRYGGPCGLRIPFDGAAGYLVDDSPVAEGAYIVRFYAFLDNFGSDAAIIFAAQDGDGNDQVRVWYNEPAAGDISLEVFDAADDSEIITAAGVGSGWHSIEFAWEADAAAEIALSVNGEADETATVDTSGITISEAQLGNVAGADTGGYADFDDFVSNRITRPGRLLVCDVNDDGAVNSLDGVALLNELGGSLAEGQPDCNEDGSVNSLDGVALLNILSQ